MPGMRVRFARIVEEQRERQRRRVFDFEVEIRVALLRGIPGLTQLFQCLDRNQRVLVNGVAVIEIPDDQALRAGGLGENSSHHAGVVHGAQRDSGLGLQQDIPERLPLGRRLAEVLLERGKVRGDALLRLL